MTDPRTWWNRPGNWIVKGRMKQTVITVAVLTAVATTGALAGAVLTRGHDQGAPAAPAAVTQAETATAVPTGPATTAPVVATRTVTVVSKPKATKAEAPKSAPVKASKPVPTEAKGQPVSIPDEPVDQSDPAPDPQPAPIPEVPWSTDGTPKSMNGQPDPMVDVVEPTPTPQGTITGK